MARSALKSVLVSSQASISADTPETTLGIDGYFDTRGMEDMQFSFQSTLNTGFSTGVNYFVAEVWGKDSRDGTAYLIETTAELVVDVAQILPAQASAAGAIYPRYVQIRWNETGTISAFTATARLRYNRPQAGKQVSHGAVSG
jgi:hypothetical protein